MDLNLFFEYLQVTFVTTFATIQLVATVKNKEKLKIFSNNKRSLIIDKRSECTELYGRSPNCLCLWIRSSCFHNSHKNIYSL